MLDPSKVPASQFMRADGVWEAQMELFCTYGRDFGLVKRVIIRCQGPRAPRALPEPPPPPRSAHSCTCMAKMLQMHDKITFYTNVHFWGVISVLSPPLAQVPGARRQARAEKIRPPPQSFCFFHSPCPLCMPPRLPPLPSRLIHVNIDSGE